MSWYAHSQDKSDSLRPHRKRIVTATDRALELATAAAEAAAEKLADDIVAFDVSDQLVITDAFVLCSAPNDRQVRAIVDAVEERLRALGVKPIRREGEREGRWVLLDFIDVVVHVQHAEERAYYALERLWRDCPAIPLPESVRVGRSRVGAASGAVEGRR
jgi:ribosome-associated protein